MDNKKLNILCLEDDLDDAVLIRENLSVEGLNFVFDHVSDEAGFKEKLHAGNYDLILSDYNLPGFSGIAALLTAKSICPNIPFICVSGTIGEDLAVELMHLGASDYILKDKLNKLNISIRRSLEEAKERKSRIEAEGLLNESEARFRDIVMSTYDWVWEIDNNFKYCYSSESIYKVLGYTKDELIGKSPFDLMTAEEQNRIGPIFLKCVEAREVLIDIENWNYHKDGQEVCLLTNGFPVFDKNGNLTGYRGVDKDITMSKNLTIELIKAKERAEAGDRLKTAFLNNISHEVRTPLNGILGFSEIVLQPDLPKEEKELYLHILNESSERLVNTITNYMDISLIVSGNVKAKFIPVDLLQLLENLYQSSLSKCQSKKLELIKQFPSHSKTTLIADDGLLEKALSHLIDNAIKFTVEGSITLGGRCSDDEIELFVKDTGTGIEEVVQNTVFQVFMQADVANTRGYEGSGLGLSIAKGLVELMGGRIKMETERGKGSTFYITFNDINSHSIKTKSPEKTRSSKNTSESPVILIAEDDDFNSSFLKTIVRNASMDYLLAFNGEEALKLCQTHPEISLILMDIKMPVMDGLSATRKIKELRRDLPIIGVTAFAMTGDKEMALEAGCNEYLTKPVRPDLLLSTINKQLGVQ